MNILLFLLLVPKSTSNGFLILIFAVVMIILFQKVFLGKENKDKQDITGGCLVYAIIIGVLLFGFILLAI